MNSAAAVVCLAIVWAILFPALALPKLAARNAFPANLSRHNEEAAGSSSANQKTEDFRATAGNDSVALDMLLVSPTQTAKRVTGFVPGSSRTLATGIPDWDRRDVIRDLSLYVGVKDARAAMRDAMTYAESHGVYVENSNYRAGEDENIGEITFRIPSKYFDDATRKFAEMGLVLSESVNSEDVTGQIISFEAKVKALRVQEEEFV